MPKNVHRADSLRTWDLQASLDGKNWVVLRVKKKKYSIKKNNTKKKNSHSQRHNQDISLSDKFATHTWEIPPLPAGQPKAFRQVLNYF